MHTASAALISCLALTCLGSSMAQASCAEDLTRIQTSMERAKSDLLPRLQALVDEAQARARARDSAGCEAATSQALQLLQLPVLPPVKLSTPMTDSGDPARADKPSKPAASPDKASPDGRAGSQGPDAGQAGQTQSQQIPTASQNPPRSPFTPPQGRSSSQAGQQSSKAAPPDFPLFLSSRDLIGIDVMDRDNSGHNLGRVDNLIIDRASGRTLYVLLKPESLLDWDRDRIVVPYDALLFSGRWDRPTLRLPTAKIESAPRIRERDLEALVHDPEWRRAVTDYFGSTLTEGASGVGKSRQASATPTGPRPAARGTPAGGPSAPSSSPGQMSGPKAQPGEGAMGPTAGSGSSAGATTSAALHQPPGGPDPIHGQALAKRACAACHTFNRGGPTRVGPNLFDVTARPVASVENYTYSTALKAHKGSWDAASLDAFLKNPRSYAAGTYMAFPGISSDRDRQDVVAYLESLTAGAPK